VTAFFFFQTAIAHADGLFSATVTQCTDGDTLVLDTGQRVRLAGVDTPEKGSKDTPPQYYAREAARFTCERTRKQRVKVIPLPGASRDRYQRLVAEIILPDGRSLNEQLLQQGMASFYAHKNLPSQLVRRLTAAQKDALDKRAGCWGFILTRPTSAIGTANVFSPKHVCARPIFRKKIKSAFRISKRRSGRAMRRQDHAASGRPQSKGLSCTPPKGYSVLMNTERGGKDVERRNSPIPA
jgi:endonuclease YncB( thermonuclease family)